jgi:CDP-diacylglycerol--glycerol-3-phosphate 3-phosphatidyltransferase
MIFPLKIKFLKFKLLNKTIQVDSISKTMHGNESVRVKILLDYCRGLRGKQNSKTLLEPLIEKFNSRFSLFLYHTPRLRGILKRILSERANEIMGVMHMKINVIDNAIIISG